MSHFEFNLTQISKKCAFPWETKLNIYKKTSGRFFKLAGVPFCFSLLGKESYTCTKKFGAFLKIVGHSVLFFITVGKTAKHIQENFGAFSKLAGVPFCFSLHFVIDFVCRVRPTRKGVFPRSAEPVGGTPAHEAENRFWTTATPIVRTFGHGGGTAEGNWI